MRRELERRALPEAPTEAFPLLGKLRLVKCTTAGEIRPGTPMVWNDAPPETVSVMVMHPRGTFKKRNITQDAVSKRKSRRRPT